MIRLDDRLRAIADLVPEGKTLADIGTDHAYLPAALLEAGRVPFAIVTDKNEEPAEAARHTIRSAGLSAKADVRVGDGLAPLSAGEAQTISLSGMGGVLMKDILSAHPGVVDAVSALVLQPQSAAGELRTWLYDRGWHIDRESLAEEGGHLYVLFRAVPGRVEKPSAAELAIGPLLCQERPPLFGAHIESLLQPLRRMVAGMERSEAARLSARYREAKEEIEELEAYM